MGDVTDISEHLPHTFFEAICIKCCHRWIVVVRNNILLKKLECPSCNRAGNVINTGQTIDD